MADITNSTQDVSIIDNSTGAAVKVNSNGELLTAANISVSSLTLKKYTPLFHSDRTHIPISTTDVSLFSYSGVGKLDFISFMATSDEAQFILLVDGVEVLRQDIEPLNNEDEYNLEKHMSNGIFAPEKNHIIISWSEPVDFLTGFEIKSVSTGNDFQMESLVVKYRGEIQ